MKHEPLCRQPIALYYPKSPCEKGYSTTNGVKHACMTCPFRATRLAGERRSFRARKCVSARHASHMRQRRRATRPRSSGAHGGACVAARVLRPWVCGFGCSRVCKHPRSLPTPRARNWALMDENARSSSLPGANARAVCPWRTRRRHAVPWETPRHTPFPVHVGTPTFFEHTHRRPVTCDTALSAGRCAHARRRTFVPGGCSAPLIVTKCRTGVDGWVWR